MDKTEHEVLTTVQAMNKCWTCGELSELERLGDYFHERMVAITPVDRCRLEGRKACIAGWSNFARSVAIRHWAENDVLVDIYGDAAVVTYYYELFGETAGSPIALAGRDMLTLVREHGRWQVVANQFSPFPNTITGATT